MPFTLDMFRHMSMKDIGDLCKEHKVKSFTTLKLDAMLEKLNYVPDSDSSDKKVRVRKCPRPQAKKHQGETMKGEDGNMYISTEKDDKWSWKKSGSNSTSTSDDEATEKNEIIVSKPVEEPVVNVEDEGVEETKENEPEIEPEVEPEAEPEIEIEVVKKEKKTKAKKETSDETEPKEKKEPKKRLCPLDKAKDHPNERMKGEDGKWWESKPNKNDVYSWKKSA